MESMHETREERIYGAQQAGPHQRDVTYRSVTSGSAVEALEGVGVIALAIIGLTGTIPLYLAPIAAITYGVALAAEGASVASRYSQLARADGVIQRVETGGGAGAELVGGLAGGILGILALIGIAPVVLLSVAAIVFGAAMLLGAGSEARMSTIVSESGHPLVSDAVIGSAGVEVLVGIGAVALGIVALTGIVPLSLALIALLTLGAGAFIQGTAVIGSMVSLFG